MKSGWLGATVLSVCDFTRLLSPSLFTAEYFLQSRLKKSLCWRMSLPQLSLSRLTNQHSPFLSFEFRVFRLTVSSSIHIHLQSAQIFRRDYISTPVDLASVDWETACQSRGGHLFTCSICIWQGWSFPSMSSSGVCITHFIKHHQTSQLLVLVGHYRSS